MNEIKKEYSVNLHANAGAVCIAVVIGGTILGGVYMLLDNGVIPNIVLDDNNKTRLIFVNKSELLTQ